MSWTVVIIFATTIVVGVLVHWFTFRKRLRARFEQEVQRRLNEEIKRRVLEQLAQRLAQDKSQKVRSPSA